MEGSLIKNRSLSRFELAISGDAMAVASVEHGRVVLRHSRRPFEFSGRAYGTRLARAVSDTLCSGGARVVGTCPFIALFAARNAHHAANLDGRSMTSGLLSGADRGDPQPMRHR